MASLDQQTEYWNSTGALLYGFVRDTGLCIAPRGSMVLRVAHGGPDGNRKPGGEGNRVPGDFTGGDTHGGHAVPNETALEEEQLMPDMTGGNTHGGRAAAEETTQEERPMPDWSGGSTHGGGATTDAAKEATTAGDEAGAPTSD